MPTDQKVLYTYVPDDMYKDVKKYAYDHNLKMAEVVRVAIREFIDKPRPKK
jgi:hypothetical protein